MAGVLWTLLLLPLFRGQYARAAGTKGWSCRQDDVTFELVTGFVYSAPKDVLDTRTGTLKLSDCIAACQEHANCQSLNFETGLCVLFSSSAETHPGKAAAALPGRPTFCLEADGRPRAARKSQDCRCFVISYSRFGDLNV